MVPKINKGVEPTIEAVVTAVKCTELDTVVAL